MSHVVADAIVSVLVIVALVSKEEGVGERERDTQRKGDRDREGRERQR